MIMVPENVVLFRPYAPPANMQAFLHRLRRMNMPPGITRDLLKTIGISENIIPRLFATLRFLELITDRDEPTDTLRGLAGSTEDEYHQLLEKTIRSAYARRFPENRSQQGHPGTRDECFSTVHAQVPA